MVAKTTLEWFMIYWPILFLVISAVLAILVLIAMGGFDMSDEESTDERLQD